MGIPWKFEQTGSNPKTLTLEGYSAPFGRPRQKAVCEEEFGVRVQTVRYPGNDGPPTRHLLGTKWTDEFQLTGRWMDRKLGGAGLANLKVDEWQRFIAEQKNLRISWGDIVSYTGMIEKIKIGRESPSEVVWTLYILIDEREGFRETRPLPPRNFASKKRDYDLAASNFVSTSKLQFNTHRDWSPDLLDVMDSTLSSLASFSASLNKAVRQFDNITSATSASLQRLRMSIHGVKTAFINYMHTIDNVVIDTALFIRQSESDINWFAYKQDQNVQASVILGILADMDREAEIAERGRSRTTYTGRNGDSWEMVGVQFFGDPDGADLIRQANGVRYGELPTSGRIYQIPQLQK